jgi:hypothetical protein
MNTPIIRRKGDALNIDERVCEFYWSDGQFRVMESCDGYYDTELIADDVRALIDYLSEQLRKLEA